MIPVKKLDKKKCKFTHFELEMCAISLAYILISASA